MNQATSVALQTAGIDPYVSLIIGVVSLCLTVISLVIAVVVVWVKMGSVLKIVHLDVKQIKKSYYDQAEATKVFRQKLWDHAMKTTTSQDDQKKICDSHGKTLFDVATLISKQSTTMHYMEKVFDDIKQLVANNTDIVRENKEVAKEIKTLLEQEYVRRNSPKN